MRTRIAALIAGSVGIVTIVSRWDTYLRAPAVIRDSAAIAGTAMTLLVTAHLLLPVLKSAAGVLLLRSGRRAAAFAMTVLTADIVLIGFSIFRFYSFSSAGPPGLPVVGPGMAVVRVESMAPTWTAGISSVIALALLLFPATRGSATETDEKGP